MSDLGLRLVSAVVLGPLVLVLVWIGGIGFVLLACAAAAIIVWEWSGITRPLARDAALVVAASGAAGFTLLVALDLWLAAGALLVAAAAGAEFLAGRAGPIRLLWLGTLYAALPAAALVVLRGDPAFGAAAVFWLMFVVWATDIGGYFVGRAAGGPKLWPAVSPKKTWSGAIGGVLAALLVGGAFLQLVAGGSGNWSAILAIAALLSAVAQLGDLGESALKRRFGVKDSSALIPGHGGLMDRVDGLVAAAMLAALIGVMRGGRDAAGSGLLIW